MLNINDKDNLPKQPLAFKVGGIAYSTISESTSINAFDDYNHLASLDVPASVEFCDTTYAVTTIGATAFINYKQYDRALQ